MDIEEATQRYGPLIVKLLWRITHNSEETADIYQDVFVKFHDAQVKQGPLKEPKAWLCRTAVNAALDQVRQRRRFVSLECVADPQNTAGFPDDWEATMLTDKVRELASHLPQRQGIVFVMRYFEGLSFNEIAKVVGSSPGAARAAAFQATHKIREWLSENTATSQLTQHKEKSS